MTNTVSQDKTKNLAVVTKFCKKGQYIIILRFFKTKKSHFFIAFLRIFLNCSLKM